MLALKSQWTQLDGNLALISPSFRQTTAVVLLKGKLNTAMESVYLSWIGNGYPLKQFIYSRATSRVSKVVSSREIISTRLV